jgi:VanZ family protein
MLLFCLTSGTEWAEAGVIGKTETAMVVRGLVDRDSAGRLVLTPDGRAVGARCAARQKVRLRMFRLERQAHLVPLARATGIACVVVIIVLSLLPADERPHTGSPGQLEHVVAYFGTAVFLALGFRKIRGRAAMISLLVGLAAVLEVIQSGIPGRHSQFVDWIASSLGAGFGVLAVVLIDRLIGLSAESE